MAELGRGSFCDDEKHDGDASEFLLGPLEDPDKARRSTPGRASILILRFAVGLIAVLSLLSLISHGSLPDCLNHEAAKTSEITVRSTSSENLAAHHDLSEDFQVYPPVLTVTSGGVLEITDGSSNASVQVVHSNAPTCQELLVKYSFANSYDHPFVGQYKPPSCSFNRVSWNLTVEVAGVQYDRLGTVWLGNIEVFRTSTAEPTENGIFWTYIKDMTNFLPLFQKQQTLIFDLGNIYNANYTGIYNVTLTASYFTAGDSITPADLILPVSTDQASEGQSSLFTVPPQTASSNLTLPRNIKKAIFTVAATGQIDEEFWWSNVPQSQVDTFPNLLGYSPFREVQVFIDGMLAGVAWPWPIIFTGGVVPGLWRPIVGIDAFDLKEDEIDITPWLPLLCDGNPHNFTIRVSGLNDNGHTGTLSETTDGYWLVSGKVFIWLDEAGHITTGSSINRNFPDPQFTVTSSVTSRKGHNNTIVNETLIYNVAAERELSVSSTIKLSTGEENVFWRQSRSFKNFGNYSDQGNIEINSQNTTGYDISSSGYARSIYYPLYAYTDETVNKDILTLAAIVERSKDVKTLGEPVFPTGLESFAAATGFHNQYPDYEGASLSTSQTGNAKYILNLTSSTAKSFGTTHQDMTFFGIKVTGQPSSWSSFPQVSGNRELFYRDVEAVHSRVTEDHETLVDQPIGHEYSSGTPGNNDFLIRRLPGRSSEGVIIQHRGED